MSDNLHDALRNMSTTEEAQAGRIAELEYALATALTVIELASRDAHFSVGVEATVTRLRAVLNQCQP